MRVLIIALAMSLVACSTPVSKIIVHGIPASPRAASFATTHKVCAEVAARYGLAKTPFNQWGPGCAEYEPHGYYLWSPPPAIVVGPAPAPDVAVVTVGSTVTSDRQRREVASALLADLKLRLGQHYVRSYEDTWTEF
jgi:hypothetical protein